MTAPVARSKAVLWAGHTMHLSTTCSAAHHPKMRDLWAQVTSALVGASALYRHHTTKPWSRPSQCAAHPLRTHRRSGADTVCLGEQPAGITHPHLALEQRRLAHQGEAQVPACVCAYACVCIRAPLHTQKQAVEQHTCFVHARDRSRHHICRLARQQHHSRALVADRVHGSLSLCQQHPLAACVGRACVPRCAAGLGRHTHISHLPCPACAPPTYLHHLAATSSSHLGLGGHLRVHAHASVHTRTR